MIRVIKSYKKPMENDPFGFINLYHSDVFNDDETIYLDEDFYKEALDLGILTEEQTDSIKENAEGHEISGWWLNDNLEEETLKRLKNLIKLP